VLVDVRPGSPTFGQWPVSSCEPRSERTLRSGRHRSRYQTLADDTEFHYLLSERYHADAVRGLAYDSPDLAIAWPQPVSMISERDRALPPFVRIDREFRNRGNEAAAPCAHVGEFVTNSAAMFQGRSRRNPGARRASARRHDRHAHARDEPALFVRTLVGHETDESVRAPAS